MAMMVWRVTPMVAFLEIDLKKHKSKDLAKELAGNFEDLYPLINWLRNVLEN